MTPMIVEHPLLQHKISILRNKQTGTKEFRDLVGEIATLLCYEATRDLPLEEVEIETPITMAKTKVLAGRKLALVPILRAGMGMLDGMLTLLPAAKVGFIGLYRDEETLQPVEYFCHHPDQEARCKAHQVHRFDRCSGRHQGPARGTPRCGHLPRCTGRPPERERLHRSRSGRCRRPYLRHQVNLIAHITQKERIRAEPLLLRCMKPSQSKPDGFASSPERESFLHLTESTDKAPPSGELSPKVTERVRLFQISARMASPMAVQPRLSAVCRPLSSTLFTAFSMASASSVMPKE